MIDLVPIRCKICIVNEYNGYREADAESCNRYTFGLRYGVYIHDIGFTTNYHSNLSDVCFSTRITSLVRRVARFTFEFCSSKGISRNVFYVHARKAATKQLQLIKGS